MGCDAHLIGGECGASGNLIDAAIHLDFDQAHTTGALRFNSLVITKSWNIEPRFANSVENAGFGATIDLNAVYFDIEPPRDRRTALLFDSDQWDIRAVVCCSTRTV